MVRSMMNRIEIVAMGGALVFLGTALLGALVALPW